MAGPTSKPRSNPQSKPQRSSGRPTSQTPFARSEPPEVVDPLWLLKGFGLTVIAAFICGYLTLCLLFYQGQWQLVLHPSHAAPAPANIAGSSFHTIHFGVDETASPQLTGWRIPAEHAARYAAYTILYLPGGDGSLADALPTLSTLKQIGINVFAFDYRGYGQSSATRPDEKRMTEDAASAWQYLTVSQAVPPSRIVLFGNGVGCALAAQLALAHPEAPAIILESPRPAVIQTVLADPRVQSLPVRTLFHEDFEVVKPVSNLKIPKLFLLPIESKDPSASAADLKHLATSAATPKTTVMLTRKDFSGPIYSEQIARFLDQYLK